jgi:hypothetical protein
MGPVPDNCRHQIDCSLLGSIEKRAAFLAGLVAALSPDSEGGFLKYCRGLLEQSAFRDIEQLKFLPGLPSGMWICRDVRPDTGSVEQSPGDPVLHAAILGLCNGTFYSSDRPVIWTESRLRRRVQLFGVGDFYAD